jgi:hypothetical protein
METLKPHALYYRKQTWIMASMSAWIGLGGLIVHLIVRLASGQANPDGAMSIVWLCIAGLVALTWLSLPPCAPMDLPALLRDIRGSHHH